MVKIFRAQCEIRKLFSTSEGRAAQNTKSYFSKLIYVLKVDSAMFDFCKRERTNFQSFHWNVSENVYVNMTTLFWSVANALCYYKKNLNSSV